MSNYIAEYYEQILDGTVTVGKHICGLYRKIVERINDGIYFFDENKADTAIGFIESYCHHSKGRNDLLILELWQKAACSCIYGIVDKHGREIYLLRSVYLNYVNRI